MNYNRLWLFILLGVLMNWGGMYPFKIQFHLIYVIAIAIAVVSYDEGVKRGKRFK